MKIKKFSKREAIRFGWSTMKKNFGFFVGLLILTGVIYSIPNTLAKAAKESSPLLSSIIFMASFVLSLLINMGLIKISLKFCDNRKSRFADLFSCFPRFLEFLVGCILYNLIVFVGTLLLIIPGIIWAIKYQFFGYFIVDKGTGPVEALKRSGQITRGAKWNLFVFGLMIWGINLLGFLCLIVGLFATIPMIMIATAFVYRKLLSQLSPVVTP